jgi:ABC-type lipoprotein export system ATPase subunit
MGLRRLNVEFNIGEFVAVTGESGSGKSTLLNVLSGLDSYEEGELFINGEETSYYSIEDWENYRRQYIGFVFQNYNIIDSYSVLENVMIALKLQGYDKEKRKERALELIDRVGLKSHTHHKASKLSGGQKQRAVIARALAKDCPIIVCDEPTGNLDKDSSNKIMALLSEISQDKLVIVVTHNYEEVVEYATRRIRLFDGEVIEDKKLKKTKPVEENVILAPYKVSLGGLFTLSLRNLLRTPRRTLFTTLIFIFITAVFVMIYGSFTAIINGDTSSWNNTFANVNESRIIVTNYDQEPFTIQELETISNLNNVVYVNNHDVVNDKFIIAYYISEDGWIYDDSFYMNPALSLKAQELEEGRLPQNATEVVVENNSAYQIGDTVNYSVIYLDIWGEATSEATISQKTKQLTVVGITQTRSMYYSENMYFHQDFLESNEVISASYLFNYNLREFNQELGFTTTEDFFYGSYLFGAMEVDNNLEDNQVSIYVGVFSDLKEYYGELNELNGLEIDNLTIEDLNTQGLTLTIVTAFDQKEMDIEIESVHMDTYPESSYYITKMNQNTFDAIFNDDIYQISVHAYDKYDAEKVISQLKDLGFNVIYPTDIVDPWAQLDQILLGVVFGVYMVVLMFGIYLIVYAILKNIQQSKQKDHVILRSIGASQKHLNRVTLLELFTTMAVAYVLVFSFFLVQAKFYIFPSFGNILRYFTPMNYVFLSVLLLYLTFLLGRRFNRRIFNKTVISALRGE